MPVAGNGAQGVLKESVVFQTEYFQKSFETVSSLSANNFYLISACLFDVAPQSFGLSQSIRICTLSSAAAYSVPVFPFEESSVSLTTGAMQNLLFVGSAPVGARNTVIGGSAFTPHVVLAARRPTTQHGPTMLLGIPRLFGGRSKQVETVKVVEAAPPPPIPTKEGPVEWAKGHPFQVVAMGALLFSTGKRLFDATKTQKKGATVSEAGKNGIVSKPTEQKSGYIRAVPKRHETTQEALDLLGNTARKYIIVGGKGGVGKTSMSAAVATSFADRGQTTLIISTDPAHSLSDAFGQDVSGGDPVAVMGIDNLYAQEVDPDSMKRTFKMMSEMDGMKGMGMEDMGLDDLNSLFDTIPPGFDEAVALVEIIKYIQADSEYARFQRIVFDTAPTGHTLRLLALPDFLNGFFGKIISMKSKLGNVMSQFKGMFGGNDADLDSSVAEMEDLKRSMGMVRDLFRDEYQTEFIVATIPNMMSIAESKRLVQELNKERIPVRHLFVNQVQPANDDCTFCAARRKEQTGNIRYLQGEFSALQISTVQSFDKEIKGTGALRAMALQLFPTAIEESSSTGLNAAIGRGDESEETPGRARAELVD